MLYILFIDGAVIDRVLNFQFLELTLDEHLNKKGHINKAAEKGYTNTEPQ